MFSLYAALLSSCIFCLPAYAECQKPAIADKHRGKSKLFQHNVNCETWNNFSSAPYFQATHFLPSGKTFLKFKWTLLPVLLATQFIPLKKKGLFRTLVHSNTLCPDMKSLFQTAFQSHATRWKRIVPKNQHRRELWKFGDILGVVLLGFFAKVTSMFSRQTTAFPQVSTPACYMFTTGQLPWREQRAVAEDEGWHRHCNQ